MALWRVRTTLPDRPGALAALAQVCGDAGVNILGIQVFPSVGSVTDDLVLRAPAGWQERDVAELVGSAGGEAVQCLPCHEEALVDQPTRHIRAAQAVLERPAAFPEVIARLLDAEPEPEAGATTLDVMELSVGDVVVQIGRRTPFTQVEHARGAAMAELVSDVLLRASGGVLPRVPLAQRRSGSARPTYGVVDGTVVASAGGEVVGLAVVAEEECEPGIREASLRVDPVWRGRGIGLQLLRRAAELAASAGSTELRFTTAADNHAVLPLVLGAGLRARIKMSGDQLTVQVPLRDLSVFSGVRG